MIRLLAITDRRLMGDDPIRRIITLMERMQDRVVVQLREKDLDARALCEWISALRPVSARSGSRLMVSGRVDVARCFDQDVGVHLPEDGLSVRDARAVLGAGALIGASTHRVEDAFARVEEGANLVTLSPIFETPSKPRTISGDDAPLGLNALAEAARRIGDRAELFALGGIEPARAREIVSRNLAGIAAIRAVWRSEAPEWLLGDRTHASA